MNPGLRMSLFLSSLYLLYHIGTLERMPTVGILSGQDMNPAISGAQI